jgi:uncharacterized membrane protein
MPSKESCQNCGKLFDREQLIYQKSLKTELAEFVGKEKTILCKNCLNHFKIEFALSRLENERGVLNDIEKEIVKKAATHATISKRLDKQFEKSTTRSQKWADQLANFVGSWSFILFFIAFLICWVIFNAVLWLNRGFDPYPFTLLNVILSCLAALQAPIILMAQNRTAVKENVRAQHDYEIDLKSEMELASLHEKIDHLLNTQWQLMIDLQKVQLDILRDIKK